MTKDEVRQKMEQFFGYLMEEQELREELSSLKFNNVTEQELKEAISRQNRLLKQIDRVHKEKMLPLVNEVADFVAAKKDEFMEKASPAAAPAKKAQAAK